MGANGHVNRREGAVRHGAAQGTGKGETRVEVDTLGRLLGGQSNRRGSHCDGDEYTRRRGIVGGVQEVRLGR